MPLSRPAKIREVYKDGPNQGRSFYGCAGAGLDRGGDGSMFVFQMADDAPSSASGATEPDGDGSRPLGSNSRSGTNLETGTGTGTRTRIQNASRRDDREPGRTRARRFLPPTFAKAPCAGHPGTTERSGRRPERRDLVERVVGPAGDGTANFSRSPPPPPPRRARLPFVPGRSARRSWTITFRDARVTKVSRRRQRGRWSRGSRGRVRSRYSRAARNQLWVPLVEKAYAKSHGCYDVIVVRPDGPPKAHVDLRKGCRQRPTTSNATTWADAAW